MSYRLIECAQGSQEWLEARTGVITASRFKDAVDALKNGTPSAKSVSYAAQVAIERISRTPSDDGFTTWQMRRGTELEPMARMEYEVSTGNLASESGIALTEDGVFGYSTDGFVGDDGLIEIKCPASPEKIVGMWATGDLSEYIHQIQGGLWITGRKWCDFIMYCPQLEPVGKQLFLRRVERDDNFIDDMVEKLLAFKARVDANEEILRKEAA